MKLFCEFSTKQFFPFFFGHFEEMILKPTHTTILLGLIRCDWMKFVLNVFKRYYFVTNLLSGIVFPRKSLIFVQKTKY